MDFESIVASASALSSISLLPIPVVEILTIPAVFVVITAGGKLSETPSHPVRDAIDASAANAMNPTSASDRIELAQARTDRTQVVKSVVIKQVYDRANRHSRMLSTCAA